MRSAASWIPLLFLAGGVGCRCGDKKIEPIPREKVEKPDKETGQKLEPLPEAPKLDIAPLGPGSEALAVVTATPQGDFKGPVRPVVIFNKPVTTLASAEEDQAKAKEHPLGKIEPKLEGEWHWLGSAAAEFVPKGLVPYSTQFTVTIPKGLKAQDGTALADDYAFTFNTPRLALQESSPPRDFRWIKPDQTIKLLFDQPVKDADLVAGAHFEVDGVETPLRVQVMSRASIADERRRAEDKNGARRRPYEREDAESKGFKNQQTRYEIAPEKPFPLQRGITLVLSAALHGEQGTLPIGKEVKVGWRTYRTMQVQRAGMCSGSESCPEGPLSVYSTNEPDLKSLQSHLAVTPAVALDWDHAQAMQLGPKEPPGWWVSIPGRFKPGTGYSVHLAPGTADVFGQTDTHEFSAQVKTRDLEPTLETGGANALIERSSGTKLPLSLTNIKHVDVRAWAHTPSEMARDLAEPGHAMAPHTTAQLATTLTPQLPWNERQTYGLELGKLLSANGTGLVEVWLSSRDVRYAPSQGYRVMVQITDLAVHLQLGPKSSLAWVTRLSDGTPVAGADVALYDASGKSLWNGKSGADGLADIPGASSLGLEAPSEWQVPFALVAATQDGDTGIATSAWSEGVEPYEFNLSGGWEGSHPDSSGFLFTDRGIYRPGDTVHLKGIARYRRVGQLTAPQAGSHLVVTVNDSRGEKVLEREVGVNRYGTFTTDVDIPAAAPTGNFEVAVAGKTPSGPVEFHESFTVAEYRAPQFKVDVALGGSNLIAGDALNGHVFARYLFGGAMSDAKARWSVHRESTPFAPPGNEQFNFGQETWWEDDQEPGRFSDFFASGDGRVSRQGDLAIAAGSVEAPGDRTFTYTVEAEVEDVNRQTVAGRETVTVHPAANYVGLRAPTGFPKAGQPLNIDTLVVNVQGKRAAGKSVAMTLSRRTWKSIRQKEVGGFVTVSEPVGEKVGDCKVDSSADGPSPCSFDVKQAGLYIARATVSDSSHRKHTASLGVYVLGSGFVSWQRNDTERVDLVPDKTHYDVGDTAHVLIKSPYPKARALLAVEREGILERRSFELEGSVQTVDIPITEEMVPNVFASVLLVRPRVAEGGIESGADPGRPAVRVGLVKLDVERKVKRLSVSVVTAKPEYQPGQEVSVDVTVHDAAGKPAQAELTVYAVDDAVLRLTHYQVPDPIAAIFPERPISVRLGEPLLNLVGRRGFGEKGEDAGGGGGASGGGEGYRTDFRTTVLFKPDLETGADGKAHVTFKLPDNLTTFRIFAVAVTADDRFGSAATEVKVNKPLLVLPAAPRFARVGDKFEAGVVVHSYGGAKGEATVTAVAEHAKLTGPAEQKVTVSDDSPREVRFQFSAEEAGTAVLRFKAVRGADKDGVEQKIPIELPVAVETVATYGDTPDSRVEGLSIPKDVRPEMGGLELTMASTALGHFEEGMRQLVDYPYGCLEQQSSRLVPFVALREIAGKFGVAWKAPSAKKQVEQADLNAFFREFLFDPLDVSHEKDPDKVVRATVESIERLQDTDGSFRYWADAQCSDSWSSAYATLALHRAADVGYPVNPEVLNHADAYLDKVAGGTCRPCEGGCPDETRVMALYTLARGRTPKPSYYEQLYKKRQGLPLFSQALLADAMFVGGGDRGHAKQLLQEILNQAKVAPAGVHFEETHGATYATLWHSDTRTSGAVLATLTDIQPDHPFVGQIAHYLEGVRRGDGQWRTTQEAAFSLMGLAEVVRTKEKDTPDFTARATLGKNTLMEELFKGRSLAVREKSIPMSELHADAKLTMSKEGAGVLYYSAALKYAPKDLPLRSLDHGLIVQRWFEPYAGGGQATRFNAGDLVRIRIRVGTNQERHWAAFEVPLPAGLEAVDTSLATTARLGQGPDEEPREPGYEYEGDEEQTSGSAEGPEGEGEARRWAYQFWSPFEHVEQRDSKIIVFADHLPPGVHTTSFVARATTPGTFLLKPASGQLMYEPEVFGRSEGGSFEVISPAEVSAR